jgi:hypothetical protein
MRLDIKTGGKGDKTVCSAEEINALTACGAVVS